MIYDLTALLTTISAVAASIVAILGGFIASKLISLNSERETVNESIDTLNKDLAFLTSENSKLLQELNEDDAESFILDNIESLLNFDSIENCYSESEQNALTLKQLFPYWTKALNLMEELIPLLQSVPELNSDEIPIALAKKYKDDSFSYAIIEKAVQKIERLNRKKNSINPILQFDIPDVPTIKYWRTKYEETINSNNIKISNLEYDLDKLSQKKKSLRSPKGMKLGLCIFAMFSLLCIILLLCFTPFKTDVYNIYIALKCVFIIVFAIGIISIFIYLIFLLKYNTKDSNNNSNYDKNIKHKK